jgi:hypothetical protein
LVTGIRTNLYRPNEVVVVVATGRNLAEAGSLSHNDTVAPAGFVADSRPDIVTGTPATEGLRCAEIVSAAAAVEGFSGSFAEASAAPLPAPADGNTVQIKISHRRIVIQLTREDRPVPPPQTYHLVAPRRTERVFA